MTAPAKHDRPARKDRLLRERVHDAYRSRREPPEPTFCPHCGAVHHQGRWQWRQQPAGARAQTCPACRRTQDNYPGGVVEITGDFPQAHKSEVLSLMWNLESKQMAEHPLERIMSIENGGDTTVVRTTGMDLARGIGEALLDAYEGDLDVDHPQDTGFVRVRWSRG